MFRYFTLTELSANHKNCSRSFLVKYKAVLEEHDSSGKVIFAWPIRNLHELLVILPHREDVHISFIKGVTL